MNILYSNPNCPFAKRARIALNLIKFEYQIHHVDFQNKPQEMLHLSPKGTVPVLLLNNNKVIDESADIVNFAYQKNPALWETNKDKSSIMNIFHDRILTHYRKLKTTSDDQIAINNFIYFMKFTNQILMDKPYIYGQKLSTIEVLMAPFISNILNSNNDIKMMTKNFELFKNWLDKIVILDK